MKYTMLFEEFSESLNESVLPKALELLTTCEKLFPQLKEIGPGMPIRMTKDVIILRWKGQGGPAIFKVEDLEGTPIIGQFTIGDRDILNGQHVPLDLMHSIKI